MSNINLLPEELRRREQKELEHLAKQKRVEKIMLSRPLPAQQALKKPSDKPKKSWWKEIFGTRPKKLPVSEQGVKPLVKPSFEMDLLAASKNKKLTFKFGGRPQEFTKAAYAGPQPEHRPQPQQPSIKPQPQWQPHVAQPSAPRPQQGFFQPSPRPVPPPAPHKTYIKPEEKKPLEKKKSFWAKLFAKKSKVPKPVPAPKPVAAPPPVPKPAPRPQPIAVAKPAKKEPRDSWWKILHGLFTFSKKKSVSGLHVAGEHAKVFTAPIPAQRPPVAGKPEIKPTPPSYQPAPRPAAVQPAPAKLRAAHREPNFALLMVIFVAAWVLPVLLIYGCSLLIKQQQAKINLQIAQEQQKTLQLNEQLSPYLKKQAQLDNYNSQLSTLKSLLQNQNSWSTFFTLLEKYTLDDVYYLQLSAEANGQMSLSAMAPTYQAAAQQTAVFSAAGEFVREVKVNEAQEMNDERVGQVMINFQPRLYLSTGIFNKNWETK